MPTENQSELFEKPRQIVVGGNDFHAKLEAIQRDGGRVTVVEAVTGHNALWKLRISWPDSMPKR
ncbi:MAG TPA: hypothetical protein VGO67_23520 [Verrucomicrobiae bacterium]